MTSSTTSFSDCLSGITAFYRQPNYVDDTRRDFEQHRVPVTYERNTKSKRRRTVDKVASIVIFPIGAHKIGHWFAGQCVVPSANFRDSAIALEMRQNIRISASSQFFYKRMTVAVDGYEIDSMIMGQPGTLPSRRWVLVSNGNGNIYEDLLTLSHFKIFLINIQANALFYNYPGTGSSLGKVSLSGCVKACRTMLKFLEDDQLGIGAKQILCYGYSLGGGILAKAYDKHHPRADITYVHLKDRTFSFLSKTAANLFPAITWPLGPLVKISGWNIDTLKASQKLTIVEIVIQASKPLKADRKIVNRDDIIGDGVIKSTASLGKALLRKPQKWQGEKSFFGRPGEYYVGFGPPPPIHAYSFHAPDSVVEVILQSFNQSTTDGELQTTGEITLASQEEDDLSILVLE